MKRSIGAGKLDIALLPSGGIKEHGGADDPAPKSIDTSLVKIFALILNISFITKSCIFPDTLGLIGPSGRATNLRN